MLLGNREIAQLNQLLKSTNTKLNLIQAYGWLPWKCSPFSTHWTATCTDAHTGKLTPGPGTHWVAPRNPTSLSWFQASTFCNRYMKYGVITIEVCETFDRWKPMALNLSSDPQCGSVNLISFYCIIASTATLFRYGMVNIHMNQQCGHLSCRCNGISPISNPLFMITCDMVHWTGECVVSIVMPLCFAQMHILCDAVKVF